MPISEDKVADLRVKELEMIQSIIARLANNGATLKSYCVTLTTAVCGLAVAAHRPGVAYVAFVPIVVCAVLDAQHLRNERRFRALFHAVRKEDWATVPDFNIEPNLAHPQRYISALASWSIAVFYGPIAAAVACLAIFARS